MADTVTDAADGPLFKSKLGLVLSCLGCVVGTGNIWRYPRIVANNSGDEGGLTFLILWFCGLWVWSVPILLVEYAVGRYTRKNVLQSFRIMAGPYAQWMGGFIAFVVLGIAAYYSVVLGWCFYYFVYHCAFALPTTYGESYEEWDNLQTSNYPILCHGIAVTIGFLSIIKGVKTIELVNKIIVPTLLLIVAFSLAWSLSLTYSYEGISYLFSPDWDVFKTPQVWVDAVTQNAWDTGAASALLLTYAIYMRRHDGIVSMGTITPLANNFVSLCCGIMIFCNVFSVLESEGRDKKYIVSVLKDNGPANTGLTFIWMPLLYNSIGVGRFLAILFFLSLSFAGLSSLIAMFELLATLLRDFRVPRIPAAITVGVVTFLLGLPSAMHLDILVNQDYVWGFALLPCGFAFVALVWRYGADKFRSVVVNDYGLSDWTLPWIWGIVIRFVTPFVGVGIIVWWIVENIRDDSYPLWHKMSAESLVMVLCQWLVVLFITITANVLYQLFIYHRPLTLDDAQSNDDYVELSYSKVSRDKAASPDETAALIASSVPHDLDSLMQRQTKDDYL
ncbi:uncharacterized sodium-dependent transporter YocR-like [Corticium candelabrum]|uniref:uncharacterized sodium-dependent transporter YocR-like n=1 Tax=Corticium candelabrum TaxID=121492 RepID=UPI002E26FDC7|nr:uncharacterized sodium-dependent transporter YocR-like [Corticium candelabrum]